MNLAHWRTGLVGVLCLVAGGVIGNLLPVRIMEFEGTADDNQSFELPRATGPAVTAVLSSAPIDMGPLLPPPPSPSPDRVVEPETVTPRDAGEENRGSAASRLTEDRDISLQDNSEPTEMGPLLEPPPGPN